ncbi:MAG: hypothetical protein LBP70_03860 [Mycoplasmataceae bacterium]|nr:hypothetical protein [Mycoplasmataceae bacterium]
MLNSIYGATHSGANIWLVIGLTIIIALPFLGCNIALPIILRRFKQHEFKASDQPKEKKFFSFSEHKVWSALFLITVIFEFAAGIAGIVLIATAVKAGQGQIIKIDQTGWTYIGVGIAVLGLMCLSVINLIVLTYKRKILFDKLRK